jgi:hypothetical protein
MSPGFRDQRRALATPPITQSRRLLIILSSEFQNNGKEAEKSAFASKLEALFRV